jgi:hypothetical protein
LMSRTPAGQSQPQRWSWPPDEPHLTGQPQPQRWSWARRGAGPICQANHNMGSAAGRQHRPASRPTVPAKPTPTLELAIAGKRVGDRRESAQFARPTATLELAARCG